MTSTKINVAVVGVTNGLGNAIATARAANPSGALQGVHTVISTLFTPEDTSPTDSLLEGAKAAGVKQFIPSEFALAKEGNPNIALYSTKISYWEKAKGSGIEYTSRPLRLAPFVIDVKERKADIPGTGDVKIMFATVADIGKYWPEEMGRGSCWKKFKVAYITPEELKKRKDVCSEKKDIVGQFQAEVFTAFIEGKGEIKKPYLNMVDVQPTKVKEFMQRYWRKA
ncbi:hypothetical protein BDQ17DRAFT_1411253 [Cyathus striatus]|nr:hypothetical protein BDQ17DRAFT_1411253 [Cyathus striatus]